MVKRTVVFDRIGYATGEEVDDPTFPGRKVAVLASAAKGDVIELPSSEASRLDELGATTSADADVDANPAPPMELPDPDEVAKVAGIVDRSDEELPPTPTIDAKAVEEAGQVAGVGAPGGTGVELHDNERTVNGLPGLAKFLAPSATVEAGPSASDEELRAMKATELVAYVNQHNDEADRVEAIEVERGDDARVTVIKAIEAVRAAANEDATSSTPQE